MELKLVKCTTCGYQTESQTNDKYLKCKACDNYFLVQAGETLNSKDNDDVERLKKLRINLRKSININDHNMIFDYSQDILKILPEDYLGQYFYAYAAYNLNQPKLLKKFFIKKFDDIVPNDLDLVVEHMGHNVDLREFNNILEYIKKHNDTKSHQVKNILNTRINKENNYAVVNRDVFICFRSSQIDTASKVVEVLENDGHTCWISTRNLRPDDLENYWHNIYDAIDQCKLFLVISSQEAMLSKDVQKEIQYANKIKMNKLEYKIDETPHTTLFKHTFDGIKWINAIQSSNFDDLKSRVFETLSNETTKRENVIKKKNLNKEQIEKNNLDNKISLLVKRIEVDLKIGNIEEALKKVKSIKAIDYENEDGWFFDFVISFCLAIDKKRFSSEDLYNEISILSQDEVNYFLNENEAFLNYKALFKASDRFNLIENKFKLRNIEILENEEIEKYLVTEGSEINLENLVLQNPTLNEYNDFKDIYNSLLKDERINKRNAKFLKIQEIFLNVEKGHLDQIEKQKKHQDILEKEFHNKIDTLIKDKLFSKAKKELRKAKVEKSERYYQQVFLTHYKLSSFDEFLKRNYSINEKKQILRNYFDKFKSFSHHKEQYSLIKTFEEYKKDIEDFYENKRKKRKAYSKKIKDIFIRFRTFIIIIGSLLVFVIGSYLFYQNYDQKISIYSYGGIFEASNSPEIFYDFFRVENSSGYKNRYGDLEIPVPIRKGYVFEGWYTNLNFEGDKITHISPNLRIPSEINLHAKWSKIDYVVNFYLPEGYFSSGEQVFSVNYSYPSLINRPPDPTRTGYTFDGWYFYSNGLQPFLFTTRPSEDIDLFGYWTINQYTISFDSAGGSEVEPVTQDYNTPITTVPDNPTREGYTFIGWDTEIPNTMPAEDLTVTALWQVNQYTITFVIDPPYVISFKQNYGTKILPPSANRRGHTFIGWDTEIPNTMPAEDLIITALWQVNEYTITFDSTGGSQVEPITQEYNTPITEPENPTREGHIFMGWFRYSSFYREYSEEFTFDKMDLDLTLTALWSRNGVINGDMNTGITFWRNYSDSNKDQFGFAFGHHSDGYLVALVTKEATEFYNNRIGQLGIPFEIGKTYQVTFDAVSDVEKEIAIQIFETRVANIFRTIGTEWATYSYKFTMIQNEENLRSGILFGLGSVNGITVDAEIWFDNIYVDEVSMENTQDIITFDRFEYNGMYQRPSHFLIIDLRKKQSILTYEKNKLKS